MPKQFIVFLSLFLLIGCSKNSDNTDIAKEPFDPTYQVYSSVLQKYVKSEQVNYLNLKENRVDIDNFINQLAGISKKQLEEMPSNDKLAFWINAYNGITLRSIIDNYPIGSIKDIKGVWTDIKWNVAEQELTLDYIEHKILRPNFNDARIHFAVNCASIGCPPLFNQPFTGQTVDSLLDVVTSLFTYNNARHQIDYKNRKIVTSELFTWFTEDFISSFHKLKFQNASDIENAVLNMTYQYLDDSSQTEFSQEADWEISYTSYDWSLNDVER